MSEFIPILTALIAGAASLVAITLSKEQKVSEFRQAWIDALRADLTTFFSSARAFARVMEAHRLHGSETLDPTKKLFTLEKTGDIRLAMAQSFYSIKLRLNSEEAEHKELLRLLWQAIVDQTADIQSGETVQRDVLASVDRAADFAGPVLKREWERVKEGERAYRTVRKSAIIVVILSLIAVCYLWICGEKSLTKRDAVTPPAAQEVRQP